MAWASAVSVAVDRRAPRVWMTAARCTLASLLVIVVGVLVCFPLIILTLGIQKISAAYNMRGTAMARYSETGGHAHCGLREASELSDPFEPFLQGVRCVFLEFEFSVENHSEEFVGLLWSNDLSSDRDFGGILACCSTFCELIGRVIGVL